jgi:hypothetical protein
MASLLGASYLVAIILQLSSPPEFFIFPALIIIFTFLITIYLLVTSVRAYPNFIKKNPLFKANFRHKYSADVTFQDPHGDYTGTVSNLSISGGFFMAKKVITLEQIFDFTVPLGEQSIQFTAKVVRISMDEGRLLNGFGVKIIKISREDKAKLKAFLIANPHILN